MILERLLAFRLPLVRGEDVRLAQLALTRAGSLRGDADGVFGPVTRDAVISYQRRERLAADGVIGPLTWARLLGQPALTRERPWQEGLRPYLPALLTMHGAPLGPGRRRWRLARAGVEIEGEATARKNPRPEVAARCWATHRAALEAAATRFAVPVELLLASACTESAGRADAVREEPGFTSDAATPHRVSTGLMQTLISTAREALSDPSLDRARLLDPAVSALAGAAYIRRQAPGITRFDPPLVATAYNAGSLRADRQADNPWGLVQTRRGNAWHADVFIAHLGDAYALFASEPPGAAVPTFRDWLA
ncbi:peptidoglycan-binding protein [Roseococcus pinisoli]|uniref:Peptidoglycan-binding protein n=1 Tax=Roseococcus pinisoli TaxID=2835040 RepID=A0ABS5Q754_9PROT|nr:peptidoglycan-binding protein [Roseococcus pinisoli]MBS7809460.1 peptidoglycan-binding protein [Roseococcus pinisoli]